MKAKSLSVFCTKLRPTDEKTVIVSVGQIIEGDDNHLHALSRNGLVEIIEDGVKASAKPETPRLDAKAKAPAKSGTAAKPAKAKAVKGKTVSSPQAGKGEAIQAPSPDGTEQLPPIQVAPQDGKDNG